MPQVDVVLASTSPTRLGLLTAAGVTPRTVAPGVDEETVKAALRQDGADAPACAEALAELKALKVSQRFPQALVIGADQMLDCQGDWFDKPADKAAARDQLRRLAGRTHHLHTAAVVALGGRCIWHRVDLAALTMRPFSDSFLDGYLDRAGPAVLGSVGAYQLEGLGAQLFSRVEGDHFVILGLPLLPLLDFLRAHGVLAS